MRDRYYSGHGFGTGTGRGLGDGEAEGDGYGDGYGEGSGHIDLSTDARPFAEIAMELEINAQ